MTSNYTFIWGNTQSLLTLQMNLNGFVYYQDNIWNHVSNIIQVVKNNKISTYHSTQDLKNDVQRGKKYFDKEYSKSIITNIEDLYNKHWQFFEKLKNTDTTKLTNKELFNIIKEASDKYSKIMGYYRATQAEGTQALAEEIQSHVSDEEASILILPTEPDIAIKEQIDWQELSKQSYSQNSILNHAHKYQWIAVYHFTMQDVIDTLKQRYEINKDNEKQDFLEEKQQLKEKQEKILEKHPEIKESIHLIQQLALLRMKVKSCWGGIDFYLIPVIEELAKRTQVSAHTIGKFYLLEEIEQLIQGNALPEIEIRNRKKCFVALWKNEKATYKSGEEAEHLAKQELQELYDKRNRICVLAQSWKVSSS